jgi:hypothetical protein
MACKVIEEIRAVYDNYPNLQTPDPRRFLRTGNHVKLSAPGRSRCRHRAAGRPQGLGEASMTDKG